MMENSPLHHLHCTPPELQLAVQPHGVLGVGEESVEEELGDLESEKEGVGEGGFQRPKMEKRRVEKTLTTPPHHP